MRFISDIIQDRQGADASAPDGLESSGAQTPSASLLDEDAPATDAAHEEETVANEQLDQSEEDVLAAADPIRSHEPRPAAHTTEAASVSLLDPFDRLLNRQEPQRLSPAPVSPFGKPVHPRPIHREPEPGVQEHKSPQPDELDLEDMMPLADLEDNLPDDLAATPSATEAPRTGRVKTRLLGFSAADFEADDPFEKARASAPKFPVGWLVVISEQGRGASFTLKDGVSSIGRGEDQTVCLDFGDNTISRENHASIAYDPEQKKFFVGHSGKANLVRKNNVPLLSTEELRTNDTIRLGQTTLRFVAFCGDDFDWEAAEPDATHRA